MAKRSNVLLSTAEDPSSNPFAPQILKHRQLSTLLQEKKLTKTLKIV